MVNGPYSLVVITRVNIGVDNKAIPFTKTLANVYQIEALVEIDNDLYFITNFFITSENVLLLLISENVLCF